MFKRICSYAAIAVSMTHSVLASAATGNPDNSFNPAFSLILSGVYSSLQQVPAPATGFAMAPAPEHEQGFTLGESEMGISANIDPQFRGAATLALDPAGAIGVENAFVQTTSLGSGLNLKFGRFFSGLGYLNEQHAHAWDFTDQPLVYAVLWENQLAEDGVQLKWLAPTDTFLEFGVEMGKGSGFPGTERSKNGSGAGVLFVHVGDDIGVEHSWRAGLSLHHTRAVERESVDVPDLAGNAVTNLFSGDSRTIGLDLVWKFAPNGNVSDRYLKMQTEFFQRKENGDLSYDTGGVNVTDTYSVTQRGFYVQGVYQFMPHWRAGLRHDRLAPGIAQVGVANAANVIADYGYQPKRTTLMLDYSPSEFSRLRLQFANDQSQQGLTDNQVFVQYIMSLGAHGAHSY